MDSFNDTLNDALAKVFGMKCPCSTCERFSGEYDDVNGMHIVYCEDGKTRCVNIETGCAWYKEDIFSDVTDVN